MRTTDRSGRRLTDVIRCRPGAPSHHGPQRRRTGHRRGGHRPPGHGVPAAGGGAADPVAAGADPRRFRRVRRGANRDRDERRPGQDGGRGDVGHPAGHRAHRQLSGHRENAAPLQGRGRGARSPRAEPASRVRAQPGRFGLQRLGAPPQRPGDRLRRRPSGRHGCDPALSPGPLPLRAQGAIREQAHPDTVDGREGRRSPGLARLGPHQSAVWTTSRARRGSHIARRGTRRQRPGYAGRDFSRGPGRRQPRRTVLPAGRGILHDAHAVEPLLEVGPPVIGRLRAVQRSEEGQALVLAAIFGLVLMLCVLGTVNLGRAVYDKVQLQAAADSAAYSQAALEARVMNFTAYTNRAMVVHYASLMAATSYLTWVHFIWAGLKPMLGILSNAPYIGPIAAAIENGLGALLRILDAGIAALCPLLSAANMLLYGLQEGAWHSVWLRLGKPIQPEAHSGDSAARPYQPIWPRLLPLANQTVFAQTRGHLSMPQNAAETIHILTGAKSDAVQQARLHMLEIANSARQPWVSYGDRSDSPSLSPMARHFKWKFSVGLASFELGSVGRTEMGSFPPGSGSGGGQAPASQIWSAQRLQLVAKAFGFSKNLNLLSLVALDQIHGARESAHQYFLLFSVPLWLRAILPGVGYVRDQMSAALRKYAPVPAQRLFWMSPYVYFAPRAKGKPAPGPTAPLGNFAQPDVVVGALRWRPMISMRNPGPRGPMAGGSPGTGGTPDRLPRTSGWRRPTDRGFRGCRVSCSRCIAG